MISSRKSFIQKLREKLLDPRYPGIRQKILENHRIEASRLFDGLPQEFDSVFSDENPNVDKLCQILMKIKSNNTELTDQGPQFTRSADMATIKNWANAIIRKACQELLTEKNVIKPEVLELVGHTEASLTSHNLICAYFSIASQYMINLLYKSDYATKIMADVFQAYIEYMNKYPSWVDEILKDRIISKPQAPSFWTDDEYSTVRQLSGAAALGVLFFGGVGLAYAMNHEKNKNDEPEDERTYENSYTEPDWYKL